ATALVYGCGTLGLLAIAILRALYPATRVLAVARFAHQRALAERFGAAAVLPHAPARDIVERVAAETGAQIMTPWYGLPWLHGSGLDVVYDTVGLPETLEVGLRIAAARGAIVVTGVEVPRRFEWTPLYFKEISIIGSNAFGVEEFEGRRRHSLEIYLALVGSGRIHVTPLLTHRFALEDCRAARRPRSWARSSGAPCRWARSSASSWWSRTGFRSRWRPSAPTTPTWTAAGRRASASSRRARMPSAGTSPSTGSSSTPSRARSST